MDERLAALCASWLKDKFGRKAVITGVEVEKQKAIDRLLNIVVVKFSFIDDDGNEGEGVAFLDAHATGQWAEQGMQKIKALA
jgi:hypothetical protein